MVKGNGLIDFVLGYDTQELRKSSETERIAASGAILNYVDNVVDNYLSEKHPLLSNPVRYGMRVALELHPHISTFNWVHDIATRYNLKQSPGSKIMEVCYYINGERKTLNLGGN